MITKRLIILILLFSLLIIGSSCCKKTFYLFIDSSPITGIEVMVNDESSTTPFTIQNSKGVKCNISINSEQFLDLEEWFPGIDTKAIFIEWLEHSTQYSTSTIIEIKDGKELTSVFEIEYRLDYTEKFDNGAETQVDDKYSGWYGHRDIVEVIPENYDGFRFVGWEIQMSEATVERLDEKLNLQSMFLTINSPVILRALYESKGELK
ncbi:MAG TPA: hypothetical protein PLA64_13785 [Mesotoga infera]|nr:hypothetical protein [Mesotoga infera]